jgi:hypothetical protein
VGEGALLLSCIPGGVLEDRVVMVLPVETLAESVIAAGIGNSEGPLARRQVMHNHFPNARRECADVQPLGPAGDR